MVTLYMAPSKSFPDTEPGDAHLSIDGVCKSLESYLAPDQIHEVRRAFLFGSEAHKGQTRQTGEPYIFHPLAVACILAEMHMDYKCLMAAILHDVIEDTPTAKEGLIEAFDEEIASLVDGVSKLTQIDFKTHAEAQAASLQKMLLAMTKDIRVILIKLADRLHNMRTLGVMRPEKCRRISRETLEIYAPIANRLGINAIRLELEELGFVAYWPMRYRAIKKAVADARGNRKEVLGTIETAIRERLRQEELSGEVLGRQKHLYSIYNKMRVKKSSFSEVVDVFAFRIIVDKVDTCYRVLGAVHNLYKPMPGRFKDFIAIPKANGYQSLHTVLFGPHGMPIEIQIRTGEMHQLAESGIAAHWMYKTGDGGSGSAQARASEWVKNLLDMQKGAGNSLEFLEHLKVDLFPDEVYVFTPRGKIMVLAKGATVIDFAYAVHTDVGNQCVAARVDRRLAPLRSRLFNGQTVEVITAASGSPNPAWLNFVATAKARANVRAYLKNLKQQEAINLGRRLLETDLQAYDQSLSSIPESKVQQLLSEFKLNNLEELLADVGLGNRMARLVARRMTGPDAERAQEAVDHEKPAGQLAIKGTEGMVVNFAKCCRPIPGDAVMAVFNPGSGMSVHRQECPNLGDFRKGGEDWLDVRWEEDAEAEFSTEIRIEVGTKRGVLATVAASIAEMGCNIENVSIEERDGLSSTLDFIIAVRGRKHLARIIRHLRSLPPVMRITRAQG